MRFAALLVLALALRLVHLGAPVGGHHAWRQADTAAMARNFARGGMDLLRPQVDWGGDGPGVVESEFPIYSYAVALLDRGFGAWDGWGRLLSIACSLATVWALHDLVRRRSGVAQAWWTALFYAVAPLTVYFGRAFMPEAAMLLASVLAVLWFARWMDGEGRRWGALAAAAAAMAALLKPPALVLGLPLLHLACLRRGPRALVRPMLLVFALAVLVPVAFWYRHAHALYRETGLTFGIWGAGTDKWGNLAPLATVKFYNDVFFKSIAERHLTWAGFVLCVVGLCLPRRPAERVFDVWLIALLIYVAVVTTGNQVHDYYQLPFALPAAFYIGKAVAWAVQARRRRRGGALALLACAALVPVLSGLRLQSLWRKESSSSDLARLASVAQTVLEHGALVVAVDRNDPVWLYRCGVKGWHASPESLTASFLADRSRHGARYVLAPTSAFRSPDERARLDALLASHAVLTSDPDYHIVALHPSAGICTLKN